MLIDILHMLCSAHGGLVFCLLFTAVGYLSGSVLYSYIIPRLFCHVDTTKCRDGNPGASNAFIRAGIPVGIICLILDIGKGFVPVIIARSLLSPESMFLAPIIAAPVYGHAFPVFRRFKGGKAIAVSFGVLLALLPDCGSVLILAFVYIVLAGILRVRPNERASVFAFCILEITQIVCLLTGRAQLPLSVGVMLISLIAIIKNFNSLTAEQKKALFVFRKA